MDFGQDCRSLSLWRLFRDVDEGNRDGYHCTDGKVDVKACLSYKYLTGGAREEFVGELLTPSPRVVGREGTTDQRPNYHSKLTEATCDTDKSWSFLLGNAARNDDDGAIDNARSTDSSDSAADDQHHGRSCSAA